MGWLVAGTVLMPAGLLAVLGMWSRWLRRRTGAPRLVAWIANTLIVLAAGAALVGAVFTRRTMTSFDACSPSRILAEGLSEALNFTAFVLTIATMTALWLTFATWRWHWSVRPPRVKGNPPYR